MDRSGASPWNFLFKLNREVATSGTDTNLEFYYLHIRDYQQAGISFIGNPRDPNGWNGANRVEHCVFERIGNKARSDNPDGFTQPGLGAVEITNGRDNVILHNEFRDLENEPATDGLIHGVYLKHFSIDNRVNFNTFDTISGDPLRVRDRSDRNAFHQNKIRNAGKLGFFGDWYCYNCASLECPSFDNSLKYNDFGCTGYNGVVIPPFYFHHGRACVPAGCPDHFPTPRLTTAGNTLPDVNGDGQADCSLGATQQPGSGAVCP